MSTRYEAVVCDVGGVFVVPDPRRIREGLAGTGAVPPPEVTDEVLVAAHYHGMAAFDRSEDRPERWPAYVRAYLGAAGVDDGEASFEAMLALWTAPATSLWVHRLDHNAAALARFAARVPVAIVSNSDGGIAEILSDLAIAQVGPGPGVAVAAIVDSALVGVAKPDPAVFGPALDALGLDAGRVLYVGDSYRNDVVGARAAGMGAAHLDPLGLGPPDDDLLRVSELAELSSVLG
jgi:putative hydrolase of the HAD superfamily